MRSKLVLTLSFVVALCLGLQAFAAAPDTTAISSKPLDDLKIAYFGSSVPFGQGATKKVGYTALFTKILQQRAANGTGKAWKPVNISIPGDNTLKVLKRWQKDLVPQKAKYVMYALSLGNEGIHEFGQPRFDQFKTNITKLIAMARDSGYVPVVSNCYTRNDYNATDYSFIKQMNAWINTLNVPTINLLGAVDDGSGKWARGYWDDALHPNDLGHLELAYTIVPSLFDALAQGKPEPVMLNGSSVAWGRTEQSSDRLHFKAENIVHPFTTSIRIKTNGKGRILQLADSTGKTGFVKITGRGVVKYKSATKQRIKGTIKINDGQWHTITLTHYYARGETNLYCDSIPEGCANEKLVLTGLDLGKKHTGKGIEAKNWLFYRSGMNWDEIKALSANKLLKSSLELYAPLDGSVDVLKNFAQSTNVIEWVK